VLTQRAAMIDLPTLFSDTVQALAADKLVGDALASREHWRAPREPFHLLALGKQAFAMTRGAQVLGRPSSAVAAGLYGDPPSGVLAFRGSHPVPDASSVSAGRALLAAAGTISRSDAALFLLSGGGSAIAAVPAAGMTLEDKVTTTRLLLTSGAPIEEMNAVRKHLSALKGGRLGELTRAKRRLALVLCDVPSGDLSSVASGPTVADRTTFSDCLEILRRHRVSVPPSVRHHLEQGAAGGHPETPKPGDPRLEGIEHVVLAEPVDLTRTACRLASPSVDCEGAPRAFSLPVEALAEEIVRAAMRAKGPRLLVFSGEATVHVPPSSGSGGRMQHLALMLTRALAGRPFQALCAGSDGRDGPTPHCGALVDGQTLGRAASLGLDIDRSIARFDSATACAALGVALPAFDSGTNLCDLVLVRLEASS